MKAICLICGQEFIGGSGRKKYCSDECGKEAVRLRYVEKREKACGVFEYTCLQCGKVSTERKFSGWTRKKFCSSDCRKAFYVETRAAFKERVCVQCGKIYMSQNPTLYCSHACANVQFKKTKEEKQASYNKRARVRRKTDPKYVIRDRMRSRINHAIRRGKAGKRWQDLLGYTVDDLKKHLQKQFKDGMTWKQFLDGKIHIDHKIPVAVHNFKKPSDYDFKRCFALSNLQPLWAFDNISKGARINKPFQQSLCISA